MNGSNTGANRRSLWWFMSAAFTVAGTAALSVFGWGLAFRFDAWSARAFILPVWVAILAAAGSGVSAVWARKRGAAAPLRPLRILLWTLATGLALWAWFPFTERLIGWWLRHVTMFRFG